MNFDFPGKDTVTVTGSTKPLLLPGAAVLHGRFALRTLLQEEDTAHGAPAVWLADSAGASFIAKVWTRCPSDDIAVRTIWNHEVRSLLRLDGLPRAHEHFASLEAIGADEHGYHVIIDGGGRQLLSAALDVRDQHEWLRRLDRPLVRARLWQGLHRLSAGLTMLHDQGILHRALAPGCVFTDLSGECDFRLSGFEWSLRLSAAAHGGAIGAGPSRMRAPELELGNAIYSVASDWFDFGLLAAELVANLKVARDGLEALNELRRDIARSSMLSEAERHLIKGLLLPNPDARRVECAEVSRRVAALAKGLAADQGSKNRPLLLGVHLTSGSELANAIFRASRGRIRIDDAEGQIAFIKEDLSHRPTVTVRAGPKPHYAVHGRQISYQVRKHEPRQGAPTWRAGFCSFLDKGARNKGQNESLNDREVRVAPVRHIDRWLADPTIRAIQWDQALPFTSTTWEAPGSDAYDFLRFTNTTDALLSAARIWPVTVVRRGRGGDYEGEWVVVEAAQDEARDRMARALGLEPTARQMERAFVDEIGEVDGETPFHIVDEPRLTRQEPQLGRWVVQATTLAGGARRYVFQRTGGDSDVPVGAAFLRPADLGGSYVLLERRLKAIEALRDQATMLRALEVPGSASRDTMEDFQEDASVASLDERKRQALHAIWRAQPIFALQGPPGTGKTAMAEALVRRGIEIDPSLQFVATAQANATTDSLGEKLSKAARNGAAADVPLVVRLDEDEEKQSALAPARLAVELAERLEASELGRSAPPHIARRLAALSGGSGQEGRRERQDMARLVSRAANVVLATTTSRGLSELLEEGKRFDWCLVEEAGKAHGFDLALPMLASHRMLMIGDHEQLPAFNEVTYHRLLSNPQKARDALTNGAPFIPRSLGFDLGPMESEEAMQAFEARCARWFSMVRTFGHIFEESKALPPGSSPIAERLNEQHRMHPEICDLVRACFYPDLRTADVARERLESLDPFSLVEGAWMPPHRIVFVDMPWIQSAPGARGQDVGRHGRMVLSSQVEAEAVVDVLGQFVPRSACDLQVLAPYNVQVGTIRRVLAKAQASGRLPHLSSFAGPKGKDEFGATIDGFQGEEADIVVVSLVRNNDMPLTGGVGFLSERPRLNVMLSRARRKLVLVGSWEFFTKRANDAAWKDPASPLHHLATVFHELGEAIRNGTACKVPFPGAITR